MPQASPVEMVDVRRKDKPLLSREEASQMSAWMAQAIISRLAEDLEDLNATSAFRTGFQRCCAKLLLASSTREERVLFFHEAIPGFTVMLVKREGWSLDATATPPRRRRTSVKLPPAPGSEVSQAASEPEENEWDQAHRQVVEQVISTFVSRTGNRVMSIEAQDVIVLLFPAADLKKNLQDMGFWFD